MLLKPGYSLILTRYPLTLAASVASGSLIDQFVKISYRILSGLYSAEQSRKSVDRLSEWNIQWPDFKL